MPADLNGYNRLFGGRLMQWIDVVAGVVARRHSGCEVTTASVDQLEFQAPAFVNDTIAMEGRITHVGRTSMEVRVDTFVESLAGSGGRSTAPTWSWWPWTRKPTSPPPCPPCCWKQRRTLRSGRPAPSGPRPARHGGASKTGLERALAARKGTALQPKAGAPLSGEAPAFFVRAAALAFRAMLGYNKAVCGKGGAWDGSPCVGNAGGQPGAA